MGEDKGKPRRRIGDVAMQFGLNVRTLRYYEAIGLLPASSRLESGYRVYSEADIEQLRFVLQAKRVGFRLEEIRRILRLGRQGKACGYVRDTLSGHIAAIDAQIVDLKRLRADLSAAKTAWQQEPEGCTAGRICGLIEGWLPSPTTTNKKEDVPMASGKRLVEVFSAGCPLCDPVVQLVQRVVCDNCDVTIHNLQDNPQAAERAKAAGVERVPAVLVDGKPAGCCSAVGPVTEAGLRAAGVGAG